MVVDPMPWEGSVAREAQSAYEAMINYSSRR